MSIDELPVILVSAPDEAAATTFISELVDNDVSESYKSEDTEGCVWRLLNKYYMADVRVVSHVAGQPILVHLNSVEAHIIYATDDEERAASVAMRAVGEAGRVRVACGPRLGPALRAAVVARRYETVDLTRGVGEGEGEEDDEGEGERWSTGMTRVRDALHAHVWPRLRRLDRRDRDREPEVGAGEGADTFAALVGALPAWRAAAVGDGDGDGDADERRARAERVLAAFCRALGDEDC